GCCFPGGGGGGGGAARRAGGAARGLAPPARPAYSDLMRSVAHLAVHEHTLQRRSITQAALFGAFTVFWTIVPLQLHDALGFTQTGIGVFALVGASGAVAAPIAGRMADAGLAHRASGWMLILAAAAMLGALLWGSGRLAVLVGCAIALDFSVQAHQVFSQSEIYRIDPGARSRINTVFMTTIFAGGAVASIATGLLHDEMGWGGVFTFGLTLPLAALIVWIVHDRRLSAS
ncbi:MAG: MFS transporter, partial [Pseudoclavibacter sp.]